ncbi:MAG: hypothetical protein ACI9SK_001031 [Zhongshania sp.]|jgi:hypothetical protein
MTQGVGSGWNLLIHQMCVRLEASRKPHPVCTQIKTDRSGRLCFYVDGSTDQQDKIIELAEDLSEEICPDCGEMTTHGRQCCPML